MIGKDLHDIKGLIRVSQGEAPADLIVRDADILDVFSGSLFRGDIWVHRHWIAYVGGKAPRAGKGTAVIDGKGKVAIPGFVDAHGHADLFYNPSAFADVAITKGATTVFSDAQDMVAPSQRGQVLAMRKALYEAGLSPADIKHVNAHGTSTEVGDRAETVAIKRAFGEHAYKLAVSSTKSMTGHLLGGAGGIEAGITVLAIRDQIAPPTINYENPDPLCDLDYVPNQARPMKIEYALSNSFGFGGTNGCLIFKRYRE